MPKDSRTPAKCPFVKLEQIDPIPDKRRYRKLASMSGKPTNQDLIEPTPTCYKAPMPELCLSRLDIRGSLLEILGAEKVVTPTLVFAVVALACGAQTKRAYSSSPLSEEQLSVYSGFLDQFGALHIKNLSQVTLPLDFNGFPEGRPCLTGVKLENSSDALKIAHIFGPEITKGREIKLVDALEQTKLLKQRNRASANQPNKAAQTGNDLNFLIFSEIAFDIKHRFAVVKYFSSVASIAILVRHS